ncbi:MULTISPECIES: hypothetical protein [Streptomyces]|uniref:hypothetical protein n=1 Tax=Streptomyces TaxID=1883 RepID=UPI00131D19C5|nr:MULTISPECIES: hypothetical protein [Streptomyces]
MTCENANYPALGELQRTHDDVVPERDPFRHELHMTVAGTTPQPLARKSYTYVEESSIFKIDPLLDEEMRS